MTLKVFHLNRKVDVGSGLGKGIIADGIIFHDGAIAVRWRRELGPSTSTFNTIEDMMKIHGKGETEMLTHPPMDFERCLDCQISNLKWLATGDEEGT